MSGLLSKAVLRPAKSGSGERISKTVKQRMAEYYHDMLWQNVGELAQQSVLWYDLPGYVHLPFALQHPRICLGLANIIQDNMYSQPGGNYRTRAIITRSLYTFYPLFGSQKRFFNEVFSENYVLKYG